MLVLVVSWLLTHLTRALHLVHSLTLLERHARCFAAFDIECQRDAAKVKGPERRVVECEQRLRIASESTDK